MSPSGIVIICLAFFILWIVYVVAFLNDPPRSGMYPYRQPPRRRGGLVAHAAIHSIACRHSWDHDYSHVTTMPFERDVDVNVSVTSEARSDHEADIDGDIYDASNDAVCVSDTAVDWSSDDGACFDSSSDDSACCDLDFSSDD